MLRNKIRYILILIMMGFLAILYNEYFMGILFLTIVIFPLLLFAILFYVHRRLSYEMTSVAHVLNKGEAIPISIQLHNPTIFPIDNLCITISYYNTFSNIVKKQDFFVSIDNRTTTTVTCNLKSFHTGNLVISLSKIKVFDYLKIFSLCKKDLNSVQVAILPYYYELTEDFLENCSKMQIESDSYSTVKSGDDPSEVFAIRQYREGDRLQRIHWKLSLKQDQLMIKEFSEPLNCSLVVFVDIENPQGEDMLKIVDAILECALSLSFTFMLKGYIHYLAWYDKVHGECKRVRIVNEKDLFEAVDGLLNSGSYKQDNNLAAMYYAEYPNEQYTDLFYVTNKLCDQKLDSLVFINAINRQILYIDDSNSLDMYRQDNDQIVMDMQITTDLVSKIKEKGMGLLSINPTNIKRDLEEFKLS